MDDGKIQLISGEAKLMEVAGRRKFSMILDEPVLEYEKRMLCDTECPWVLPMKFLAEEGTETVYYDITGFLPLGGYIKGITAESRSVRNSQKLVRGALDLLTGIMESIKGMEAYLIDPERISIQSGVIFIHSDSGRARLAFCPNQEKETFFPERILLIVEELGSMFDQEEVNQYLNQFKDTIRRKNPGLDGMIADLGKLKREANYIYWNAEDFRKGENEVSVEPEPSTGKRRIKLPVSAKPVAIQAVFAAILAGVYLSGIMDPVSLAGLAVIAAGADLWIMRKLHYL